jgi:hypothetical protein
MEHDHYSDAYISGILNSVKTIAMIGASPKDVRPSNIALKYLVAKGYRLFPINPGQAGKEMYGRMTYASLADIPEHIDMVDVFRGSHALPAIVDEILALDDRPDVLWAQLTVRNDEAARNAEAAGLKVVMNRCPKIEYGRLSGEISWSGVNSRVISSRKPVRGQGVQALGLRPGFK